MRLALLYSGFSQRSPSLSSQLIFSQVTVTSPKAASRMGLPESLEATLQCTINVKHHLSQLRSSTVSMCLACSCRRPACKSHPGSP